MGSETCEELVWVDLTQEERDLLRRGLGEWGGPARPTEALAPAIGFPSVAALLKGTRAIADALEHHEPLSRRDWARALVATEVAFASDYYGSGCEWHTTTGIDDAETIRNLRAVQRKLVVVARLLE